MKLQLNWYQLLHSELLAKERIESRQRRGLDNDADLPAIPSIGKEDRLDRYAFVGSANAARTRLASDINSTDVLDDRSL